MPTALDRVQVLLQPDEYAELTLLAKEDRRSLAAMAAVLISEAIKARVKSGDFVIDPEDPAYAKARERQLERAGITPEALKKVDKEFWDKAAEAKAQSEEVMKNTKAKNKLASTEELEAQMKQMMEQIAALKSQD
ncbi:hypothetical protein SynBIOSU31_00743 [Synechococcus sp. BIOS-U3-1]|uniref:ribbon-helix-helix domain-containing protein n=1 Tax=Synechococcus sp. BIOS-U3-1 TaxID=1400865 RepID=UPI00164540D0|nr:hypothetical protein [Synechococcus sp. BIOS-U3-1]QNI57635.1 hypothetical protein SynBIOSU31_00743 [Synechococcus sp. BIOS-U3-1]